MKKICALSKDRVLNADKDNIFNEVSKLIYNRVRNIQNNIIGIFHGLVKK